MSKTLIGIIAAFAITVGLAVWVDNRIAAGVGALLLFVFILFGYVSNKRASAENYRKAERGARQVRDEIAKSSKG
ncbi:hypothetical protein [Aurantiacibacter aquimixticola]|uniref:Uncharacterized protein n=1 Tax=Aurantiacibacter aquimixticola TaxID=1958945 RepID=A0A419RVN9_9SPHN|nr:hypothetical protein [Aurantiacibacter aquimixticola]RJY09852.1 hypothetical protein D6201_11230 [Aurantiacibacter aquimixticola]